MKNNKKIVSNTAQFTKKIKIAIFHFGFFYSGGGERLVLEEIDVLNRLGYEVSCFTPVLDRKTSFPDIIKTYPIFPILPQLPTWVPHRYLIQILLSSALIPLLFWRFRKFDAYLGANQPGPWFAFILSKINRKPYVVYLAQPTRILHPRKIDKETGLWISKHSRLFPIIVKVFYKVINLFDQISILNANQALANGSYIKGVLQRLYKRKFINCPGMSFSKVIIKKERFRGTLKLNRYQISKPFLLVTNRHFPQKKIEYALFTLASVLIEIPETTLAITGSSTSYTSIIKKLAKELGVERKVAFVGLVNEKALRKLYASAAVYLYTSPEEDFGLGIIESLASAVPVVAWESAGPKNILKDEVGGVLAKPFDIGDFSKKTLDLLKNKSLNVKIGLEGKEWVEQEFSTQNHGSILDEAIKSSLNLNKMVF